MQRRSFLKFLAGAAAASLAPAIPYAPALARPVEALRKYATFSEMVAETLRQNQAAVSGNISRNNPLYQRLQQKGRPVETTSARSEL